MQTTETWQHRHVITNGIRMHYVTQGSGPLIVLLHGFPEFWYSWRFQLPFLAEHGYTAVAWVFAARYPEMTGRLIVMNAPHPLAFQREMRTLRQLRKSWYIFFFQLPWLPEYMLLRNNANEVGRMLRGAAVQKTTFPREVTARFQQAMSKPGAMKAALNYYRQIFGRTPWSLAATSNGFRIKAPTLIIWGEQDIALGIELLNGLEQWVDSLQIQRIPDSGHWVQQEQPGKVNQLMLDFLSQHSLDQTRI